jgi:hypothetical protein
MRSKPMNIMRSKTMSVTSIGILLKFMSWVWLITQMDNPGTGEARSWRMDKSGRSMIVQVD